MQTGVLGTEILGLGLLHGLDQTLGDQFGLVVDAGQILGGIEQQGGGTAEQGR